MLGFTGSLAQRTVALAASSLPAHRTVEVFQENLKPKYLSGDWFFFFPFSVQAVSGLSIIVRVEQSVIFITHRFLFCTVLCRLHFHITGVILECKKDASLAVRTRAGERPPRTAPTLPLSHKIFFFLFLWGSVSLNVALETYSVTGLGQNLAVSFLNRVFSLLLVFTEIL